MVRPTGCVATSFRRPLSAINALVDADPGACWSLDAWLRQGSDARCPDGCVYSPLHGVNATVRRIVVVRSYDPGEVADAASTSAQVNLVALFIEGHIDAATAACRSA